MLIYNKTAIYNVLRLLITINTWALSGQWDTSQPGAECSEVTASRRFSTERTERVQQAVTSGS